MGLSACDEYRSGGALSFGSSDSDSSSPISEDAYAYLEIYASLVNGADVGAESLIASCEVATGSPEGTDLDCASFSYDEGLLYNSRLRFKWGTNDADACPFIKFYPYYYRASNSATFEPEWSEAGVDCSDPENSDEIDCYGGIAPLLISSFSLNFPTIDYLFSVSSIESSGEVEVESSSELARSSNRLMANPPSTYVIGADRTMADGTDGIVNTFAGAYTGNLVVLRPYKVVCENLSSDPIYTLNFYLRDYDITNADNADDAMFNNYPDWDSTLNTLDPQ